MQVRTRPSDCEARIAWRGGASHRLRDARVCHGADDSPEFDGEAGGQGMDDMESPDFCVLPCFSRVCPG